MAHSLRLVSSLAALPSRSLSAAAVPLALLPSHGRRLASTDPASATAAADAPTPASHAHEQESYASFSKRYVSFFTSVQDIFELQRGLNNCFAYDLVPSVGVVEAALRAARRVDDYATAVRVFEGVRQKVENKRQYEQYLDETKAIREELGITTKEELYES